MGGGGRSGRTVGQTGRKKTLRNRGIGTEREGE